MPIYEYGCEDCDNVFDALRKESERETTACPVCSGVARQRVTAPAGIRIKGFPGAGRSVASVPRRDPLAGISAAALRDIPTVGRDGKLRDVKTGKVLAG